MSNQRLPRASAFQAHDVMLKYPQSSWSGISAHDGAVVLGMKACDVHVGDHGCSCLLWGPAMQWDDAAAKCERREHCELAMLQGAAHGLLAYGQLLGMDPDEYLSLRVMRIGGEYWAKWGFAARLRADVPLRCASPWLRDERLAARSAGRPS
jgi:hypothetical protein